MGMNSRLIAVLSEKCNRTNRSKRHSRRWVCAWVCAHLCVSVRVCACLMQQRPLGGRSKWVEWIKGTQRMFLYPGSLPSAPTCALCALYARYALCTCDTRRSPFPTAHPHSLAFISHAVTPPMYMYILPIGFRRNCYPNLPLSHSRRPQTLQNIPSDQCVWPTARGRYIFSSEMGASGYSREHYLDRASCHPRSSPPLWMFTPTWVVGRWVITKRNHGCHGSNETLRLRPGRHGGLRCGSPNGWEEDDETRQFRRSGLRRHRIHVR